MSEKTSNLPTPWYTRHARTDLQTIFKLSELFANKLEILIGRSPTSDIWLNHPAVSRTHASLRREPDGSLMVKDLGSTHGVTLNGSPVQGEAVWKPQTTLNLGPQALWLDENNTITVINRHGTPNLEAKDLTVIVPGRKKPILDGVSFTFKPGQFVCVLGPSGAGKSTLVRCMQGHQATGSGSLLFGGFPILSNPTILNGLVGYAPQKMSLQETLTVRQVVWFAAKLRLPTDTSVQEIEHHVDATLHSMGLEHLGDQKVSSLSGGEHKRVELASELVVDPSILLVDEATSSLDPASEARVMEVLSKTAKQGKLVLCVTHHMDNISKADTVLILADGKVVYQGPPGGACAHFGVEYLPDAFVRLEDEGTEKWVKELPKTAAITEFATATAPPPRSIPARFREITRQAKILTQREFAATVSDRRYLFLAALMPALFALILIGCHWMVDFSRNIMLTRDLNEDEKSSFKVFWPVLHEAAKSDGLEEENLTIKAQLGYMLGKKPAMRKSLASDELDQIIQGAIDGTKTIFPDKMIKNPLTTFKYLSVQVMGISFMGMLLGLTLMVRDGAIFAREKAVGLSPLAYLASKMSIILLATGFQTFIFDGILESLFHVRQLISGLEPIPTDYRIGLIPMLLAHWFAALGCACLGVVLGALTLKPDRAIILLGAMMLPQLTLGTAMSLATTTIPKTVAFLISPTYWGLRASQISPMENGMVVLPTYMRIFGDSFIQSVPLALAGMTAQIILYLFLGWWMLRFRRPETT
ncbi:MAG: hypothetical protein RL595_1560 [Planctomycetota bacterium]|jgi:ABC-type multidrug transport system ATPase subunit